MKKDSNFNFSIIDTAEEKGWNKGRIEIILFMYSKGKSNAEIAELTNIPIQKVEKIIRNNR